MRHKVSLASILVLTLAVSGCEVVEAKKARSDDNPEQEFPIDPHDLLPQYGPSNGHIAAGVVTGDAPDQPIGFSHYLHSGQLNIDCQYCHFEARKSIHGGVPPLQTCMGCHVQVKTYSPQVQKIHEHWCGKPKCTVAKDEYGLPIPDPNGSPPEWSKVHDLPDYVYFAHNRHVRGGVQCTECHGQVKLQGTYEIKPIAGDPEGRTYREVENVMIRESTLQMGWCLNCHAEHPSIDENYGESADLRRAELKDCWTCHT